ncbi:hypothetical protein H0H93_005142, partial [Arthromyces matolae]
LLDSPSILSTLNRSEIDALGLETIFKLQRTLDVGSYWRIISPDEFTRIKRDFASELEKLSNPNSITRVSLSREYGVREWWNDTLYDLMARKEPLSVEESQTLGFEATVA